MSQNRIFTVVDGSAGGWSGVLSVATKSALAEHLAGSVGLTLACAWECVGPLWDGRSVAFPHVSLTVLAGRHPVAWVDLFEVAR